MKKNRIIMPLFVIITLIAFGGINTSFEKNKASENSFTLAQLTTIKTANDELPYGYNFCGAGSLTMDGTMTLWCGDCMPHWIWITYNGDCRLW